MYYPQPEERLEGEGLFYEEGKTERMSGLGDAGANRCAILNTGRLYEFEK